jgi:hypothetical protein
MGIKKGIVAIVAAVMLMATPAVAGFKNSVSPVGVKASHKTLEIQHLDEHVWVMVEDRIRVQERIANNKELGPPNKIIGMYQSQGNYMVYMSMGFFMMPMGVMHQSAIAEIVPVFKTLEGMYPKQFITFTGFEDIWVYMDTTEGQEDYVLSVIRELNQKDLASYEGDQ